MAVNMSATCGSSAEFEPFPHLNCQSPQLDFSYLSSHESRDHHVPALFNTNISDDVQPIEPTVMTNIDLSNSNEDPTIPRKRMRGERIVWTPEEDEFLRKAVQKYGDKTEKWAKIAACVPGRTNKNCRKRWFHSLDPSLRKGGWTVEEDHLLRTGVEKFRGQWSKIAERIPGRTDDQCAKRWRESLDPHIDRGAWTPEDDLLLLEKFKEYGTQWQKIAAISFPGRPGLHCRNRWRKIQRSLNQIDRTSKRRRNQSDPGDKPCTQNDSSSTSHTIQTDGSFQHSPNIPRLSSEETLMQETYLDDDCDLLEDNAGDLDDCNDSNSDEEKPYGCAIPDCKFECSSPSLLFYHFKASHHGTTILKPFRCTMPGCEERKRYKNINGLQYHVNFAKNTPGHSGHSTSHHHREIEQSTRSEPVTPIDEDAPLITNDAIEGLTPTALAHPNRASFQALTTPAEIQSLIPSSVAQQIVSHQAFNIPHTPESSAESSPISRDLSLPKSKSSTLRCPELGCGQIFPKLNNLASHMAKNHGHQSITMESNEVSYGQDSISIPEGDLDGVGIDMEMDMDIDMELAYLAQGNSSPAADANNMLFLDDTDLQAQYESLTRGQGALADPSSFPNTGTAEDLDILAMNKLLFANHMSYMLNTAINSNPYSNRIHFGTHINVSADDPFTLPSTPVTSANVSPRISPAAINIPADSNGDTDPMTIRNHPSASVFGSMPASSNNIDLVGNMPELMMERSKSFGGGVVSAHISIGSCTSPGSSTMPTPESMVSPGSPDSVTMTLFRGNTNNGMLGLMEDMNYGASNILGNGNGNGNGNGKQKHMKKYEEHEKPFKCLVPGCGKGYRNINGLKNHLLQAHGSTPKRKMNTVKS